MSDSERRKTRDKHYKASAEGSSTGVNLEDSGDKSTLRGDCTNSGLDTDISTGTYTEPECPIFIIGHDTDN